MAPAFSVDIPGRIRGALIGRPHDTATYDDVLDARPRPLPVLAERLATRWNIKAASAYRRLEAFLRDGESMHTDRVSALLEEVGLTVVPGEGYKYSTTVFPPVSLTDKEKDSSMWSFEGYWNVVLGANRSSDDVVREFGLDPADRRGVDEWLGQAEGEALAMAGESVTPPEWAEFHERVLDALCNVRTPSEVEPE